ncbi:MAG: DedA family protein [Usitatibacter sp.]
MVADLIDLVLHFDAHLVRMVQEYGLWVYAILFAIIFSETGFVVTPFLPGDSLLFVAGAIAATGSLNVHAMVVLLIIAAVAGNSTNYAIGRWLGKRYFTDQGSRWLNPAHLERANAFYEQHGGKAVVLSRFLPIVRTYIPFVAGMGGMPARRYTAYNVAGGVLWIASLLYLGYFFGNIPWIRGNLTAIIVGIIVVTTLPVAIAFLKSRIKPSGG